ncbi:unnamed protein product [Fraxinus pennsylvanica]|uniref:Alpha/beta hydrolase fold-3 domain-containing protein n=1 Tax=Fraxinus pennsylvanica TaxID=56036 RepID=A0AAD1ZXG7_9LAMI|nr:unnamed protein product [Fraxinus pennsylvanica]
MPSDTTKEVLADLSPVIKLYKDGTVERLISSPHVPPSPDDAVTGVVSKDLNISPVVQARLHLPKLTEPNQKLPVLVYYHGGGFCLGSAFTFLENRYINILAAEAKALIVSVEYRLAPEHPLPIAYEDSWETWLTEHGDFSKIYIGGDSAGGNIVHNILLQAGAEPLPGDVKIVGGFLSHPYFWGSKPIGSETEEEIEQNLACKIWLFVYPSVPRGIDNAMINPFVDDAPSLSGLGCSIASHVTEKLGIEKESWLTEHGDFSKIYIGGDSAGGNIVHNILLQAGAEPLPGDVKIVGGFLSHPYFWGSKPIGSETEEEIEQNLACKMWLFVYPSVPGGIDNAMINPFVDDAPSLSGLGCSRLLVCLAEKDPLTSRGILYVETVKKSGWNGEVEMVEVEGEDHCFQFLNPETEKAKDLIKRLASFISY